MRSCAAALFALAIVTECLCADRSRQRSPVRSVPVAANIKRDVDFNCPEEFGYYPHPTDCTLYYVCVFGGALLESCTGGLMYSHELQTCDWPRNVGCDGASALGGEELERISEREPPPPPAPRRTPPPPPPRAQPNPIVTSRGQPKYTHDEYEKQQQLYAEVDDLPPVEEIESDRQQRVYRGQPSTIGQVQKDRDGYSSQVSSGRNFNTNIIPASIPQNSGKIGSFSFGSQVDERRTATVTPAPQSYSDDNKLTDSHHDELLDIETNEINNDVTKQSVLSRKKREVEQTNTTNSDTVSNNNNNDTISKRSSRDELEFYEIEPVRDDEDNDELLNLDDTERGKRQIRYYTKNGHKNPGKNWSVLKPIKFVDSLPQPSYNPNVHSNMYHQSYSNQNNYYDSNRRPHSLDSNTYSVASPFLTYKNENSQNQFKASLPDPYSHNPAHNPLNVATQIITKSPPISALNNQNPFAQLTGGFYNNAPQIYQNNNHYSSQGTSANRPQNQYSIDSSILPSTVVTGKPILMSTSPKNPEKYKNQEQQNSNEEDSDSEEEYDSSEDENDEAFDHGYPKPPYEFTHPSNKYANIENPFANPDFDFDKYLSKLSNGQFTTHNPKKTQQTASKLVNRPIESSTPHNSGVRSSTLNYQGMSTPRPFSILPNGVISTITPHDISQLNGNKANEQYFLRQQPSVQTYLHQQHLNSNAYNQQQQHNLNANVYNQQQQPQISNVNTYNQHQHTNQNSGSSQNAGISLEAVRPKLKPPNFKDDRQLPISYSFSKPIEISSKPNNHQNFKGDSSQPIYSTARPYLFLTATGAPIVLSSPKAHFVVKNEKLISQQPYQVSTGKPFAVVSHNPHIDYINVKHSTQKPLTTLANEQLSALHHYWKSTTESISSQSVTLRPSTSPDVERLKSLFAQAVKTSMQTPTNHQHPNIARFTTTTTIKPPKRRPIPKPSPEMNDYYYDDDEYYEPPVKSQYMPSTEIKPQRPQMAQNYKHYDDNYEDIEEEGVINISPRPTPGKLSNNLYRPEIVTKNHNDLSIVTKSPLKDYNKNDNGKIPVPVLLDFVSPTPTVAIRPQLGNFQIVHGSGKNNTIHMRRPYHDNGPNTVRPPKYLNQTTLRPYTVRHRLAKPTAVQDQTTQKDTFVNRERDRHPNIVAQMMMTTPHDSHNQETRITKAKYDGRTNSLEPTESVAPLSYSPSPRPKMLYNGSQNYSPDQLDPFYAIYDEDGELYKDTDYVQQYNVASVRPAVQQTYRGTPPPARRPVDNYSPRPVPVSQNDYDDDLIQGQINNHNQNQFQSPVRLPTRGEGNELGYEHIPSSVKTTIYEATPISTTPTTTSTSTTTQRPTTAHFTEAMTPSRYTPRSSTDENPIPNSEPSSTRNSSKESFSSFPSTSSPVINFSSLAKPFEKTDILHSIDDSVTTTEKLPVPQRPLVTNTNYGQTLEVVHSDPNKDTKKIVSLTTGFSIRRNSNNTNNPYTLTVLTRPFDDFDQNRKNGESVVSNEDNPSRYFYKSNSENIENPVILDKSNYEKSSESTMRRKDSRYEISDDYDIPVYVPPKSRGRSKAVKTKSTTAPSTSTTKYYLKSVVKRPAPFSSDYKNTGDSTENAIDKVQTLIDVGLQNVRSKADFSHTTNRIVEITPKRDPSIRSQSRWQEPTVSPYNTLNNLRNTKNQESLVSDSTTSAPSTTTLTTTTVSDNVYFKSRDKPSLLKPSYYSYRIEDEEVPDHTTEVFSSSVKNVIKAFFNSIVSTPAPQGFSSTFKPATSTSPKQEQKIVNIGYQKKPLKYTDDYKPTRQNVQRLKIITEQAPTNNITPTTEPVVYRQREEVRRKESSTTTTILAPMDTVPRIFTSPATTPITRTSTLSIDSLSYSEFPSKFSSFMPTTPKFNSETTPQVVEPSRKFQNIIQIDPTIPYNLNDDDIDDDKSPIQNPIVGPIKTSEIEWDKPSIDVVSEIASTTSTTKSTSTLTVNINPTTKSTTKSVSYPTRASRVNPAIKLAASNPASGRRSYQSSSKCSSDNSLQANPKCNEIKYQRPTTSTRGRGSAHYSKSSPESAQSTPNRGTPPTRSRPTLKPSTAIVSENTKFLDIYEHPPSRPAPVYPQPTPDKTAAKCRKDVCLLPDCYCGGKDIPGDLPVDQVPQIVLLTFDDSVNDLNKGLYADLFEKGRVNPNGCPISATFYVSHEWTDYSQVQNLYAAGHEMASHTVSHSFGEQFSQKKWNREVGGQREILAAYGGVKLEDIRGMRAPFLSIGGNKMFKMLYDSNFTYDSSMPVYENRPPSWPYTLDYKLFHDCMIPPCPTKSYPGVWEVPMVMWQDLNGGRCSMGDACANPPEAENVYKMLLKNFDRHYTTNRAPFGLFYHAAWFTQPHHKEGFIMFLDFINQMQDVWIVTNWQALQWVRDPTPISRLNNFQPFQCNYQDRPKKCNNPKVCNLWHKSGVRYMRTCQPCPEIYPWTGKSGIRSSRIDNDNGE